MGDPKRLNRKYDVPRKQWNKEKIISDRKIMTEYGLRTKKELWKAESLVRGLRKRARALLAGIVDDYDKRKKELLDRLIRLGVFNKDNKIEDVLRLQATDFLERRLQTIVFRTGLSLTAKQARQLVVHNHIAVNGKVRTAPGSLITINESVSYSNTNIKNIIDKEIETKGKEVVKDTTEINKKEE